MTTRLRHAIMAGGVLLLLTVTPGADVRAQECPKPDPVAQQAKEEECRAGGGEWGKFGAIAHLCGIYSCVPPDERWWQALPQPVRVRVPLRLPARRPARG